MPFSDILKDVVDGTEGALGALIVGRDGIPVEEYATGGDMDIQTVVVEFSLILKEIEKGSQSALLGQTREVTIDSEKAVIVLRRLNDEYYVALLIRPGGNSGKGKFLLRLSAPRLLQEF